MKNLHFDCFSGISGDMTVGSLIDCGIDFNEFRENLKLLDISGYEISASSVLKNSIKGTAFRVKILNRQNQRNLNDITDIIIKSGLPEKVKKDSIGIFTLLAEAEAAVHNSSIEKIHFHEVGAIDAIVDICGTAIAMWMLGIDNVTNSPVNTGKGFVKTEHGILPVPAPATAELLKQTAIFAGEAEGELTTPTGAAILAYYSSGTVPTPEMKNFTTGYGAGTMDLPVPNLLRVFLYDNAAGGFLTDSVAEIETSIDDMNPEFFSHLFDLLYNAGAVDVVIIPGFTKKNRPASILKVLVPHNITDKAAEIIFRETTTSGLRIGNTNRRILARETVEVETAYGMINVKLHYLDNRIVTVSPEYEDCKTAALKHNVSVKTVYREAQKKIEIKE